MNWPVIIAGGILMWISLMVILFVLAVGHLPWHTCSRCAPDRSQ